MIYLTIFWIALFLFIVVHILTKIFKWKIEAFLEKYSILYFILLSAAAFIAIITNNPISFGTLIIPTEVQWLITLFTLCFGIWKYYLNPLKERVLTIEKEMSVTQKEVSSIQLDIGTIKQDIRSIKEVFVTQSDIVVIRQDIQLIKEILIKKA